MPELNLPHFTHKFHAFWAKWKLLQDKVLGTNSGLGCALAAPAPHCPSPGSLLIAGGTGSMAWLGARGAAASPPSQGCGWKHPALPSRSITFSVFLPVLCCRSASPPRNRSPKPRSALVSEGTPVGAVLWVPPQSPPYAHGTCQQWSGREEDAPVWSCCCDPPCSVGEAGPWGSPLWFPASAVLPKPFHVSHVQSRVLALSNACLSSCSCWCMGLGCCVPSNPLLRV